MSRSNFPKMTHVRWTYSTYYVVLVASQRIQSCMPTVTITDEISQEIKNLYPERINFPSPISEPIYPEHTQHTTHNTQHTTHNTQQEQQKKNQTTTTPKHDNTPSTATQQFAHYATSKRELHPGHSHTAQTSSEHMHSRETNDKRTTHTHTTLTPSFKSLTSQPTTSCHQPPH
jgi:hypothetical protein